LGTLEGSQAFFDEPVRMHQAFGVELRRKMNTQTPLSLDDV
jgi:hypothetical protein